MRIYFAINDNLIDNQKAVRMTLNLGGITQKWFHNIVDISLEHFTLEAIE